MRKAFLCAATVFLLSFAPAHAQVGPVDWGKWKLGHLARFIGSSDVDTVLRDPKVAADLRALVGDENVRVLQNNLTVRGPMGFEDMYLVLSGLAPHQGGDEEATVWVDLYHGGVLVALLHRQAVTLFTPPTMTSYSHVPEGLRNAVRRMSTPLNARIAEDAAPPARVRWRK